MIVIKKKLIAYILLFGFILGGCSASKVSSKYSHGKNTASSNYQHDENVSLKSISTPKKLNTGRLIVEINAEKIKNIYENDEGIYIIRGNKYNKYLTKKDEQYRQSYELIRIDKKFNMTTPKNSREYYLDFYDVYPASGSEVKNNPPKKEFYKMRKEQSEKNTLIKKLNLKEIRLHKCKCKYRGKNHPANMHYSGYSTKYKGYSKIHNVFFTIASYSTSPKSDGYPGWQGWQIVEYISNPEAKLYSDIYTVDQEIDTLKNKMQDYRPIKYEEFFKLITGNTLIAESKRYCPKDSSKKTCLKIAVLDLVENKKLKILKKYPATIIYPDKEIVEKSEYGLWAINAIYLGLHTGITNVPTNDNYNPFESLVFINKNNKNKFLFKNPKTREVIDVIIKNGHNTKFLASAKQGNYEQIDTTGRTTIGLAILNKVAEKVGKSLSDMGKNMGYSESWCYTIKNEDMRNSCLANTKNEESWCYTIKNEDMRNSCLANTKNEESWCYTIKNEDMRNNCLANTKNEESWCYTIKNEDMRNSCLANTKNEESWCYTIKNEDMRNSCLANVKKENK